MADFIEAPVLERPSESETNLLRLGFMPLTDCAPLLVADELGMFDRHGVAVRLTRLAAWVALRDRIAIGQLDGGQMLSPMPIAAHLGLGGLRTDLAVVSVIARQGNTITFSEQLMAEIAAANPGLALSLPLPATALAAAIAGRRASGKPAPRLAMVFPFSSHNYLLRHWLASAGIDPEHDVELTAVPPPLVASELAEGRIDGFCAGQPWGSRAVDLRCGRIALTTGDIWPNHPEKVMAVSAERLARTPEQVVSAVAALIEAGIWLQNPANIPHTVDILHRRAMPDVPEAVLAQSLTDQLIAAPDEAPITAPGLQFGPDATYPHPDHAIWWLQQMQRWQHAPADISPDQIARLWRPDIWRRGAEQAGVATTTPVMPPCPGETA